MSVRIMKFFFIISYSGQHTFLVIIVSVDHQMIQNNEDILKSMAYSSGGKETG